MVILPSSIILNFNLPAPLYFDVPYHLKANQNTTLACVKTKEIAERRGVV